MTDAAFYERLWAGVGLVGQGAFTARFAVQWLASERKRETVLPVAFWWLSLTGGLITLTYAIHLRSLAFTLGQSMGLVVYVRNLMIADKAKRRAARRALREQSRMNTPATSDLQTHRVDAPRSTADDGMRPNDTSVKTSGVVH